MRNYLAIVRKEFNTLFVGPIAYVVLAAFFFISGLFFYIILTNIVEQVMQIAMQSQQFGAPPRPIDVPAEVMRSFFGILSTIMLFVLPMITMGIIAEEKKRGTIELLFTSPITTAQLLLAKFTALVLFLLVMLAPTVLNSVILYFFSDPRPKLTPFLIGYLGAFLLGGSLLAVGIFISSLTENQIVAAVITFALFLSLWVLDAMARSGSTLQNEVMRYLSVLNHYEDFARGIFDTQHLVFYVSLIVLGLFFTSLSLESPKWRQ